MKPVGSLVEAAGAFGLLIAMIQVLQIVKELVTPSRQKAATAKEGRSIAE